MIGIMLSVGSVFVIRLVYHYVNSYNRTVTFLEALENPETTRILPGDKVEIRTCD